MKRNLIALSTVVFVVLLFSGCRTAPIYNVNDAPIDSSTQLSNEQMEKAIVSAGQSLGWIMKPQAPGHILATLNIRTHVAVVDINYNSESFDIVYNDSTNLKYDGKIIHKNYNGWIQNLSNAIKTNLGNM